MHRFWDIFLCPTLEALRPERVIEIGALRGDTTRRLLGQRIQELHTIDPEPRFDPSTLDVGDVEFHFYRCTSLEALRRLPAADYVLIDGDHNYFTVSRELRLLEATADRDQKEYPFVVLHDVGWPYGRRDLYYSPDRIPAEERLPFAQQGVLRCSTRLCEEGGLSAHLHHALEEGTPRNGVLTAVEDFVAETRHEIDLVTINGLHGLGCLVPAGRRNEELDQFLAQWRLPPQVEALLDRLEKERLSYLTAWQEAATSADQQQNRPPDEAAKPGPAGERG